MGQRGSTFTDAELEEYETLTFLNRKEVLALFKKFKSLAPELVKQDRNVRLPMEIMLSYPELKYNPFGDRICQVFSSTNNGDCTFDDFVDMLSVFSEKAPLTFKAEYAFRIFDFDNDDMLGPEDLQELIRRILGDDELEQREITLLIQGVLCEADLDDDGMLSFAEFELILSKAIDFKEVFNIGI